MGTMAVVTVALAVQSPVRAEERERHVQVIRVGGGPALGVSLDDVGAEEATRLQLGEARGARVTEVREGSPAEKAGLKTDDVIVRYQGQDVWGAAHLARMVRETPGGRTVTLEVMRDGASQKIAATLAERESLLPGDFDLDIDVPAPPHAPRAPRAPRPPRASRAPAPAPPALPDLPELPDMGALRDEIERATRWSFHGVQPRRLGIGYHELSEQLAKHYDVKGGVLVSEVDADGPAAKAGLQAGDVITRLDGKDVADASDLREALHEAKAGTDVTVTVQRDGKPLDLKVTLGSEPRKRVRSRVRGTT